MPKLNRRSGSKVSPLHCAPQATTMCRPLHPECHENIVQGVPPRRSDVIFFLRTSASVRPC